MKSGAIVCNSGHFDVEINKGDLDERTESTFEARPLVEGHVMKDGREIFLLAEGRLVNLAAAEGHPAAVMDMSFANQALAAEYMARNHASLEKKVYPVPREIDAEIARLKLASKGVEIDQLTDVQSKYLESGTRAPEQPRRPRTCGNPAGAAKQLPAGCSAPARAGGINDGPALAPASAPAGSVVIRR